MKVNIFSYIKFFLKSTNEHGVHSPFVFSYLTECIYKKPRLSKSKVEEVLLKSIQYFNCQNFFVQDNPKVLETIKSQIPFQTTIGTTFDTTAYDLAYFENPNKTKIEQLLNGGSLHNNSMILIDLVYQNPKEWQTCHQLKKISVSIDFYWCGVLFVRREQEKEHFTIRI